jgi:hypothetical protein
LEKQLIPPFWALVRVAVPAVINVSSSSSITLRGTANVSIVETMLSSSRGCDNTWQVDGLKENIEILKNLKWKTGGGGNVAEVLLSPFTRFWFKASS